MNEIKLKPCPFCGGKVKVKIVKNNFYNEEVYFIKCQKCGAVISFDNHTCNVAPEKAIDYFNRRIK